MQFLFQSDVDRFRFKIIVIILHTSKEFNILFTENTSLRRVQGSDLRGKIYIAVHSVKYDSALE